MNLPFVFDYKFFKKEIQIQPPGEPEEQHGSSDLLVSGFHYPNCLEILKKSIFQNVLLQ